MREKSKCSEGMQGTKGSLRNGFTLYSRMQWIKEERSRFKGHEREEWVVMGCVMSYLGYDTVLKGWVDGEGMKVEGLGKKRREEAARNEYVEKDLQLAFKFVVTESS